MLPVRVHCPRLSRAYAIETLMLSQAAHDGVCLNSMRQFSSDVGSSTDQRPLQRLQAAITPELCANFRRDGFAVVDGVFGEDQAGAFRQEIKSLRSFMHKNSTHLVTSAGTAYLEKSHIHEAELLSQETQQLAPLCAAVQQDSTLAVLLSLFMPELRLDRQAIKLQYNQAMVPSTAKLCKAVLGSSSAGGGGCFPIHFDSDAGVDSRRVTAIIYLNPAWREGDGGELRLFPFPSPPLDIQPRNDRMVLFSSLMMHHRVLPSLKERYCFTIWLSGSGPPPPAASRELLRGLLSQAEDLGEEEVWRLLLDPSLYKHACKWVYRQQWAQSIGDSHPPSPAREAALGQFWREIGVVERALGPRLLAAAAAAAAAAAEGPRGSDGRVLGSAEGAGGAHLGGDCTEAEPAGWLGRGDHLRPQWF